MARRGSLAIPLHKRGRRIQSRRLPSQGALGGRALRPANQSSRTAGKVRAATISMGITALRELSAPPGVSTMGEDSASARAGLPARRTVRPTTKRRSGTFSTLSASGRKFRDDRFCCSWSISRRCAAPVHGSLTGRRTASFHSSLSACEKPTSWAGIGTAAWREPSSLSGPTCRKPGFPGTSPGA